MTTHQNHHIQQTSESLSSFCNKSVLIGRERFIAKRKSESETVAEVLVEYLLLVVR